MIQCVNKIKMIKNKNELNKKITTELKYSTEPSMRKS